MKDQRQLLTYISFQSRDRLDGTRQFIPVRIVNETPIHEVLSEKTRWD